VAEEILEAEEEGKVESLFAGLFGGLVEGDGASVLKGKGGEEAGFVDVKITGAPPFDAVNLAGLGGRPFLQGLMHVRFIRRRAGNSMERLKNFGDSRMGRLVDRAAGG
jgi:hypothetical protein